MSIEYFNQVVDFRRPKLDDEYLRGFVLGYTDSFTLINVLDSNFYLNGFSIIPLWRVAKEENLIPETCE